MAAFRSLKFRIAITIFVLECVMMAVALWQTSASQTAALRDQSVAAQDAMLTLAARVARTALLTDELSELRFYFEDLQRDPHVERVVLGNAQGKLIGSADLRQLGQPMPAFEPGPQTEWRSVTIDNATGRMGTLAVQFTSRDLLRAQDDARKLGLAIAGLGMTLIALVGLGLGVLMTRDLGHLAGVARRMAQGDRDARARLRGQHELGDLGRAFDDMADAVAGQERQLRAEREYSDLLLSSTAEGIVGVDSAGRCTFANPASLRMLGLAREDQLKGRDMRPLFGPAETGAGTADALWLRMRQGMPGHGDELVCTRVDGSRFTVEVWSHPMHRQGEWIGAVLTFVDTSERRRAEQALLVSETRLRQAVRATRSGIFEHDHATGAIYWSPEQRANFGFSTDEVVTLPSIMACVHPDDLAAMRLALQRAHDPSGDGLFDLEHRVIRRDGQVRWLATRSITVFEGEGAGLRAARTVGAVVDMTDRRATEERTRVALREKEILLKEIYHRVKNNLQMVISLLTLQARNAGHEAARSALKEGADRIKSMALVHEQLYQSGNLAVIAFGKYLQELLHAIVAGQGESASRVRLRSDVAPVDLGIETAVPLGLIVNELVTNAFKHAFPGGRSGGIGLTLQVLAAGQIELSVEDDGIGLPAGFDPAQARTLGLRLVASLAEQLGSALVHSTPADGGCRFAIRLVPEMRELSRLQGSGSPVRRDSKTSTTPA